MMVGLTEPVIIRFVPDHPVAYIARIPEDPFADKSTPPTYDQDIPGLVILMRVMLIGMPKVLAGLLFPVPKNWGWRVLSSVGGPGLWPLGTSYDNLSFMTDQWDYQ